MTNKRNRKLDLLFHKLYIHIKYTLNTHMTKFMT